MTGPASQLAEAAARRSYGRLVALLAARSSDVAGAEDALSEAFQAALQSWPRTGNPENPEAWLLTGGTARNFPSRSAWAG
jgi:RNA polymerase sigma-70 factor (ECF subfamily)